VKRSLALRSPNQPLDEFWYSASMKMPAIQSALHRHDREVDAGQVARSQRLQGD
jgi:hypothetical protein